MYLGKRSKISISLTMTIKESQWALEKQMKNKEIHKEMLRVECIEFKD
jgi:hypothetical protein